jgi:hypothetical protein
MDETIRVRDAAVCAIMGTCCTVAVVVTVLLKVDQLAGSEGRKDQIDQDVETGNLEE